MDAMMIAEKKREKKKHDTNTCQEEKEEKEIDIEVTEFHSDSIMTRDSEENKYARHTALPNMTCA
jgi:hypothetical protein